MFDLETTGLSATTCRIVEIGAHRIRGARAGRRRDAGQSRPRAALCGDHGAHRHRPRARLGGAGCRPGARCFLSSPAMWCWSPTMRASTGRFLERPSNGSTGPRRGSCRRTPCGSPAPLAAVRHALGLAALAELFGTSARPRRRGAGGCGGDLPRSCSAWSDSAQERGACTVSDLVELAVRGRAASMPSGRSSQPRRRCRHLRLPGPARPGALCRACARPAGAPAPVFAASASGRPWRRTRARWPASSGALGNEVEAALEELRMLRELCRLRMLVARGPIRRRDPAPARRGWCPAPSRWRTGPLEELLARPPCDARARRIEGADPADAPPPLRERSRRPATSATRTPPLRDRIAATGRRHDSVMTRLRRCVFCPPALAWQLVPRLLRRGRADRDAHAAPGRRSGDRDPGGTCGCRAGRYLARRGGRGRLPARPRSCAGRRRGARDPAECGLYRCGREGGSLGRVTRRESIFRADASEPLPMSVAGSDGTARWRRSDASRRRSSGSAARSSSR